MEESLRDGIRRALDEDIGSGDVTTASIVPQRARARARIVARQGGVVAGLDVAAAAFQELDPEIIFRPLAEEGSRVSPGQALAELEGPAPSILTAERTALNFLGRMSGIATLTRQFVDAVAGLPAAILDTRKTAPGLRAFDKLAVRRGGGVNHRLGLYDRILVKDNHIDLAGSLEEAVRRAQASGTDLEIEVEARSLDEVRSALAAGAAHILLDNMSEEELRQAVALAGGRARLEASGGVTLERVRRIAATGVDEISVGALTHSARALDVSLEFRAPTEGGDSGSGLGRSHS